MKNLKSLALVFFLVPLSFSVFAAGGKIHLDHADTHHGQGLSSKWRQTFHELLLWVSCDQLYALQ